MFWALLYHVLGPLSGDHSGESEGSVVAGLLGHEELEARMLNTFIYELKDEEKECERACRGKGSVGERGPTFLSVYQGPCPGGSHSSRVCLLWKKPEWKRGGRKEESHLCLSLESTWP